MVLGVDIGSRALGLALVEFEPPHRPVWADIVSIDRPDGGWAHQQIRDALRTLNSNMGACVPCEEITRVVIEDPPFVKNNPRTLKQLSAVAALVEAECRRRWPWAPVIWQTPGEWKKSTVGKGNATKDDVREWVEHGPVGIFGSNHLLFDDLYGTKQDALDAIAIAVAGAKVELGQEAA